MNMKPTPELINDWREKARQMAIQAAGYFDGVEHLRHFAELAAQWGAEQAKSSTPSVEHCLWARNGHTPCQHTQQREPVGHCPQAQQTAEPEPPEAAVNVSPYDPNHVYWNAGHSNDGVNSPLFTATQMHAHFQAGVRAGMGQSQDAKRYQWLRGSGFAHANVDLGTDLDGDNFVRYQIRFDIPEPAHSKFEDDEWSASDIDAAIDAAMQGGKQ